MDILGASAFRVTRDADIEIREDEAGDLLRSVTDNLRRRRFGAAIRLEVEGRCSEHVRELLRTQLELDPGDVYEIQGPLGAADLMSVMKLDRPDLKDAPFLPASRSIFDAARGRLRDDPRRATSCSTIPTTPSTRCCVSSRRRRTTRTCSRSR